MTQISTVPTYSYASHIAEQVGALTQYYKFSDSLSQKVKKIYQLLCHESLSGEMGLPYAGLSRINSNGIPFQWSFSFAQNYEGSLRFICESGKPFTPCMARYEQSLELLDDLNSLLGIPKTSWLKEAALPLLIPKISEWPGHWRSALWFAIGANKKGIRYKIYLNLNAGKIRERWLKVGRLLAALKRHGPLTDWCGISASVSENSIPVGIALDILPNGECGRIKVYFRSGRVTLDWLAKWYGAVQAAPMEPILRNMLESYPFTGGKVFPDQSFFVSWEVGPCEKATLKTELAVTNFNFSEQEVVARTCALMDKLKLPFHEYRRLLSLIGYSPENWISERGHKFIGVGFENDGSFHLNTYVQPKLSPSKIQSKHPPRGNKIHGVLRCAKESLFKALVDKKKWVDYQLPVGSSDVWITAFILFQLRDVALTPVQSHGYKKAQKWLQHCVRPSGWGYNDDTPTDCDSTSLGLLSTALGKKAAFDILKQLEDQCRSQQGYSTYSPKIYKGRWGMAADDISPYVLMAQHTFNLGVRGVIPDFVYDNQCENGSWSSYWWVSDLYATYGYLLYFNTVGRQPPQKKLLSSYLKNYQAVGVFEKALLLNCLYLLGATDRIGELARELMDDQCANGLWKGDALLRLPKDTLENPKNKIAGTTLFRDGNGYFTTAMTINALEKCLLR